MGFVSEYSPWESGNNGTMGTGPEVKDAGNITWKHSSSRAGVAQRTEHHHMHREVAGFILVQGTCPGCGLSPQWGQEVVQETIDQCFSLPPFPSLSQINKHTSKGKEETDKRMSLRVGQGMCLAGVSSRRSTSIRCSYQWYIFCRQSLLPVLLPS